MSDLIAQLNAALAGRYALRRELGRGGMATVFLADDLRNPRAVAIKVLGAELAAALGVERFEREIRTIAGLPHHPHILPLHDSGAAEGLPYYVMPFVEGESLRERIAREKQIPVEEAVRVAREVADALSFAHAHHIVHRDIKPENILLASGHAVVMDFGIARAIHVAGSQRITKTGVIVGTPAYMSPEQFTSQSVDGRSDVYSLGCVLYEMLSGAPPFSGATVQAIQSRHQFDPVPPLRSVRPTVPEALERAVEKGLAKTPADRFATAAEFAAALAVAVETGTVVARRPISRRHRLAVAVIPVVLGVLFFAYWRAGGWLPWSHGAAEAGRKDWILVAEFDGPADDPGLAVATRDLVSTALDQSTIAAAVPRSELRVALERAGKADTTRVDAALARELAYRSAVRTVVEGRVTRLGDGYSVIVRVVDAEDGRAVLSLSDVANRPRDLIPTVERVARRIREGLGERRSAIQASRELIAVTTPSFEAYQEFLTGNRLIMKGDNAGALASARAALTLDPGFVAARIMTGFAFTNLREVDSALAAFHEVLSRSGRLEDRMRLMCEANVADLQGDLALAAASLERVTQEDPTFTPAHNNLGYLLYRAGRYEDALASLDRAGKASPFGPTQLLLANRFIATLALGRTEEAHQVASGLKGEFAQSCPVFLATASGEWAQVESLGAALDANPTASPELRRLGALAVASAEAARGAVGSADRTLQRAELWASARSTPAARISRQATPRARLLLALVSGGPRGVPRDGSTLDMSTSAILTRGLWAAAAGDTFGARRLLDILRTRPARELGREGAGPALLEALIAMRGGHWDETIRVLSPMARQGSEAGFQEDQGGRVTLRWVVAQAYEQLGQPDSAAAFLGMVLLPYGRVDQEYLTRCIAFSFAHRQLAVLYARMGRLEEARRHWRTFSETFTRPDPEMRPLVEEARIALARAEEAARPAAP